jgi:hypothetical protein
MCHVPCPNTIAAKTACHAVSLTERAPATTHALKAFDEHQQVPCVLSVNMAYHCMPCAQMHTVLLITNRSQQPGSAAAAVCTLTEASRHARHALEDTCTHKDT